MSTEHLRAVALADQAATMRREMVGMLISGSPDIGDRIQSGELDERERMIVAALVLSLMGDEHFRRATEAPCK